MHFFCKYICAHCFDWSSTYIMSIIVSNWQHCDEQQFRTLSCVHYTIFSVVKSDLFIRALLLDRILVTEKNTRTPRVHLVCLVMICIVVYICVRNYFCRFVCFNKSSCGKNTYMLLLLLICYYIYNISLHVK